MPTSAPYICARCLRASRPLSKPIFSSASRQYHSRSIQRAQTSVATSFRSSTQSAHHGKRSFTAYSAPLKPTLEGHTLSNTNEPPPPTPNSNGSSQANYTTSTLLNPRIDSETNEPMSITISPRATRRLEQIMKKDKNPNLVLRVTVESGGCHGFQYLMKLVDLSEVDASEDTLFVAYAPEALAESASSDGAPSNEGWQKEAEGRPKVVMDEPSLELLQGSRVDYTMELIGSQFKVDNPRASSSCGCGTSFDVKI